MKAGVFWERIRNAQPANNNTNGFSLVDVGNSNSLGNAYADLLTGTLNGYQETSFNRINDISYNTYEGFVQDSWKVSRRLTARTRDCASRTSSPGSTGWASASRSSTIRSTTPVARPLQYCGFVWNKREPVGSARRIPDAGAVLAAALRRGLRYRRQRQDRAARRLGPLLLPLRPVHHRPGRLRRSAVSCSLGNNSATAIPAAGEATRHAELSPTRRSQPGGSGQQGRQAALHRQLQLHDLAAVAVVESAGSGLRRQPEQGTCCIPAAAPAATSTWFRWAPCSRAKNGGVDPNSLNGGQLPSAEGLLRPEPRHQQRSTPTTTRCR